MSITFHIDSATERKALKVARCAIARAGDSTSLHVLGKNVSGRYWLIDCQVALPDDPFEALVAALTFVTSISHSVHVRQPWREPGDPDWTIHGDAWPVPEPGVAFMAFEARGI